MVETRVPFSEKETAWHRTARFALVPWTARLLGDGPLRGKSEPLPFGSAGALTGETIDALGEMMNLAVWKFLARDCGWKLLPAVRPSAPGREGTHGICRLWEGRPSEENPPSLRFTEEAIDLLVAVYNGTRGSSRLQDVQPPPCLNANGDLLLHHLVFRRLAGSAQALGVEAEFGWARWQSNPLNALHHVTDDPPDFSRLTDPDIAFFFPWIGSVISREWQLLGDEIRLRPDRAIAWFGNLERLIRAVSVAVRKRPDLAAFLLEFFARQAASAEEQLAGFESRVEGFTASQREEVSVPWAAFLKSIEELEALHQRCHQLHPVERGAPEKCFLAAWQEMTFDEAADTLKRLRGRLRPALS